MEKLSVHEIIEAVSGELLGGRPDDFVTGISTDTRTIKPGDLFFALCGKRDGHEFVRDALDAGASGVVVSDGSGIPGGESAIICVNNPLWALGDLACYYRKKFDVSVVAVTGSVGKTITKEMLASILGCKWSILKNEMNFNNEIGLPLTLFKLDGSHKVVVLEMAMRAVDEIRRLASIAKPSVGVITNIGMAHIEQLGSQSAIAAAKSELLEELPTSNGLAVLNYEDSYYTVMRNHFQGRVLSFGSCKGPDVVATRIKCSKSGRYSFVLLIEGTGAIEIKLPIIGYHNVFNALAAAAAAHGMGVDLYTIRDGLHDFHPPAMRMELLKTSMGCTVLNDAYNANPASMSAALHTLCNIKGYKRRIAVLGDMLELGNYSSKAHRSVGAGMKDGKIDLLVTVGRHGREIAEGAKRSGFPESSILSYKDSIEAGKALSEKLIDGDILLIKGSRGMKMENIIRELDSD